jgi:U3 small nucleolar RNA-associated protein 10
MFGYIWTDCRDELERISESAQHRALTHPHIHKHQKHKIQSLASSATHVTSYLAEQVSLCRAILAALTSCFTYDVENFTDKAKFETIMPTVVATLGLRALFEIDHGYLSFVNDSVTPCVTALALCVGRDVLWKPLNHRVLMYTRDKSKTIRLATLKVLHKLFSEVGTYKPRCQC